MIRIYLLFTIFIQNRQSQGIAQHAANFLLPVNDLFSLQPWWSRTGSNRRPPACKAGALPAELRPHKVKLVGLGGLEPPTSRLSSARSNQLSYKPLPSGFCLETKSQQRPPHLRGLGRRGLCRALPASTTLKGALWREGQSFTKKEKRRRQSLHCMHDRQADWPAIFVLIDR